MIIQRKENSIRVEAGQILINAVRRDPFGFWYLSGKNGKKPIDFPSEYTSSNDAMKAIENKIRDLSKETPVAA